MRRRRQRLRQTASPSPTAPLATSRAQLSQLSPGVIRRRTTSRLPRQLAPSTPLVLRVRPRLPRLPLYLCFTCLVVSMNLLFCTIPPTGCILNFCLMIRPRAFLCKYLSALYLFLLIALWLFPLLPSLGCRLASQTAALRTAARSSTWLLWEGKYLAF